MPNIMVRKPKLYMVVKDKKTNLPKLREIKKELSTYKIYKNYTLDVEKRLFLTKDHIDKVDIVNGNK